MEISNIDNEVVDRNMHSFQMAITDMRVKGAEKIIKESTASSDEYKMLTLNIVASCTKSGGTNRIVDMIEAWSLNLNRCKWHDELIAFCKSKEDIVKAISAKNSGQIEFIIVMEDSLSDAVLDYNGYAFELRRKYKEISNFMVLDVNTSKGIEQMFEEINVLYERGNRSGDNAGA